MARALSPVLDAAMAGDRRQPAFSVLVYDLRSTRSYPTPSKIGDVVLSQLTGAGNLPPIVGPRDFTADVLSAQITETDGDYASQGIASSSLELRVVDPTGAFDPVENPPTSTDLEADGRWLRQGNVVVVREGDLAADPTLWPITFTGALQGAPGLDRNRTTGNAELVARVLSREIDYLPLRSTSANFGSGTAYADIADALAVGDMALDPDEVDLGNAGGFVTAFSDTQTTDESPLVSIAKVLFPSGGLPRFRGDGKLVVSDQSLSKTPARTYTDSGPIVERLRPIVLEDGPNEVLIRGLSPTLEKVVQPAQELARASITTGFFSRDASIDVQWSNEGTLQAQNVRFVVLASIGDAIFAFGTERFTEFVDSDGGSTGGRIDVDGAFAAAVLLASVLAGTFVSTAEIPDIAPPTGGPTKPVGRIVHAASGQLLFSLIAQQARGEYRIVGEPYEYVFPEIVGVARVADVLSHERKTLEIENHLVNDQALADAIAARVFARERAKQNQRSLTLIHDLRLEPGDIIAVGDGLAQRRYVITQISRTLQRGGEHLAAVDAFEVTSGVRP